MKKYIAIVLFALLTAAAYGQSRNADDALNALERRLIEHGILESSDGAAYYLFFERLAAGGDLPVIDLSDVDLSTLPPLPPYSNKEKAERLQKEFDAIEARGDISPRAVANALISALSPEDFAAPEFRVRMIIVAIIFAFQPPADKALPEPAPLPEGLKEMRVSIDGNNNFHVDGREVPMNEALALIENFIRTNKADHLIRFGCDRATSYKVYVDFHKALTGLYETVRDDAAVAMFGKRSGDLAREERKEIEASYPVRIIEM
jgi:hypothetical protein